MDNLQIIKNLYQEFANRNMPAVLAHFDEKVEWVRPGAPDIPFSGTYTGFEGLGKMFSIISQTIRLKAFKPEKFCTNDETVIVFGTDTAEVIATGKTYQSDWAQSFTLQNGKIIHVQVYMDTLTIAKAFLP